MKGWILALALACTACRTDPPPPSEPDLPAAFRWNGQAPVRMDSLDADSLPAFFDGPIPGSRPRWGWRLEFPGPDSVRVLLVRFPHDYQAYGFFQEQAVVEVELVRGMARRGDTLLFYRGPWWGQVTGPGPALRSEAELEENLARAGRAMSGPPPVFRSFPLQDRLARTERIFLHGFLHWPGFPAVAAVGYRCGVDTALAYRIVSDSPGRPRTARIYPPDWKGKEMPITAPGVDGNWFYGQDAFGKDIFEEHGEEYTFGIWGCADSIQAHHLLDLLRKMAFLSQN